MADGNIKKPYSDYRWHCYLEPADLLCGICSHYHITTTLPTTCDAFPEGIPLEMLDYEVGDEDKVVDCNNGIGYTPINDDNSPVAERK